jgi:ABC-2 type transport system permease protein
VALDGTVRRGRRNLGTVVTTDAPAYRVKGPAAVSGDLSRLWHLSLLLAVTDWKLRFFGSVLGYIWSLLRPLLLFGILYVVFSVVVRVDTGVGNYPLLLLVGIVLFFTFGEMTGGAVTSMVDRETLIRKVAFPRMAVPLSVALSGAFSLALNLVTVAVFVAASGVQPRWSWLLLLVPVGALVIFGAGLGMLLSALYVPFRDVRPIWDVAQQALFYATPILYPVEKVAERSQTLARVAMSNPLAVIVQESRRFLLGSDVPSAAATMGGTVWLLIPAAVFLGVALLGFAVFSRMAQHAAEEL